MATKQPGPMDNNPMDYFFWNEVAKRLAQKKFSNHQELVEKVRETIKEIPLKKIRDAISQFRSRVYAVEINKGGRIEKGLFK